ncbi:protein HESO1-like [Forsythia ovata]|uniref:Protein HESO1-like n=1 Tax=Forsythia ovata TaxID=205694 RepID=A0ABD1WWZ9_9LAMI
MALRAKVLQKKAEKFESKKLQGPTVTKERASALEPLLQDVYAIRRPKQSDYEPRRDLILVFNEIAKEIYGYSKVTPVVVGFGSFLMDLFSATSDLDLSVNFSTNAVEFPREKKIQTLRKFAKKLYALQSKGHVSGVLPITTAKVPILKVVDCGTGVECDISVENRDGILKSHIIHLISSIDERFKKLSFLMKTWAKVQNINSSKDKTLNSLSIILLVAFHLQTRKPPILPPFTAIFKDGTDPATVAKSLPNFVNYGKSNKESLAELFVTLLIKLSSVENLWAKGLCVSTYDGSWTSKTWNSKVACISVEDFNDRAQNVARAVGQTQIKQIYECINLSARYVLSFMDGQIGGVQLKEFLFGHDGITSLRRTITSNLHQIAALPSNPSQSYQRKRDRDGEGREGGKQALPLKSLPTKRIIPMQGWAGLSSGSWGQVKRAMPFEVGWTKKIRTTEGWGGTQHSVAGGQGGVHAEGCGGNQEPVDGDWGGVHAEGWGGTWEPVAGGWGVEGRVGTQQPMAGGRDRVHAEGWGGTQQPIAGGWGGVRATGWGGTQQSASGGWDRVRAEGWGGSQQSAAGGWGRRLQSISYNPIRTRDPDYRGF